MSISRLVPPVSKLIEANIRDQKLVALCTDKTTIGEFGANVLAEFCSVFPRAPPVKIKCIKDQNDRILSTRLCVLQLEEPFFVVLDDEDTNSSIENDMNPDDACELFHKWQAYAAKQGQKHLIDITKLGKVPEPSEKVLQMISEMRDSSDPLVMNIISGSLELLLREFKAYPAVVKFAENSTCYLLQNSNNFDVVLKSVGMLKYFSNYVDKNSYTKLLEQAMDKFPGNEGAILKAFEDLGGQNMIQKINKRVDEMLVSPQYRGDDFESDPASSPSGDYFSSNQALAIDIPGRIDPKITYRGDGSFDEEAETAAGLTWEKIKSLLESEDPRCRRFALEKCSHALTASTLPDPIAIEDVNVDNVLAGHFGVGSPRLPGEAKRNLKIETPTEAESVMTSLLRCLKSSIHTPKRSIDDLRFGQELETVSSKASFSTFTQHNDSSLPIASLIISASLKSPKTDYDSVQSALVCLDRLSMEWPIQTVNSVMRGFSRLLLTLCHARVEEHRCIVDIASGIVTILIDQVGWDQADMKLEDTAVARFLEYPQFRSNVLIALTYLLHRSRAHLDASGTIYPSVPTSPRRGPTRGTVVSRVLSSNDGEPKTSYEILVQQDSFAVLKGLWRWSIGTNRRAKLLALELLSGVSMNENVRNFLVRFEGVTKLIALISGSSDPRARSAGGDTSGVDVAAVRFLVKTIANICVTNEKAKQIVKAKLVNVKVAGSDMKLQELAEQDEALRFYLGMLD